MGGRFFDLRTTWALAAGRSPATSSLPSFTTGGTVGVTRCLSCGGCFHQMHHSPQRIELITSFYKHPAEIFANSILSSAIVYILCGLSPAAASLSVLLTGLGELFYHWNVNTPRWIGFYLSAPGESLHSPQDGLASAEFLRPADLGHGVRDFPQPLSVSNRSADLKTTTSYGWSEMLKGTDLHQSAVGRGMGAGLEVSCLDLRRRPWS